MTDQTSPLSSRPKRRWPRRVLVVFLVLAGLYVAYRYTLHRMVEAKLGEIRKQGYPVTLKELYDQVPPLRPEENAAMLLREPLGVRGKPPPRSVPPHEDEFTRLENGKWRANRAKLLSALARSDLVNYLATNQTSLARVHLAATKLRCLFPPGNAYGLVEECVPRRVVSDASRLLFLEAALQAEEGKGDRALDTIAAHARLGRLVADEPVKDSREAGIQVLARSILSLEYTLNRISIDGSVLHLQEELLQFDNPRSRVEGLLVLQCLTTECCTIEPRRLKTLLDGQDYTDYGLGAGSMKALNEWWIRFYAACRWSGLADMDLLRYFGLSSQCLRVVNQPFPKYWQAAAILESSEQHTRMFRPLLGIIRNHLYFALVNEAKAAVSIRNAQTALSIELYRHNRGRLPNALDELVPTFVATVSNDPFTGQPLRYKKLAKGYVVYSVGEDGNDDGGDEKKDIPFTVER